MSTNYIDQITDTAGTTHDISEGDSTRIFRATCATAAGTAAKVATLQTSNRNFSLATGVRVAVTFTYGNSAATPTLRVDGSSTGTAKTIAVATSATAKTTGNGTTYNTWGPYETVLFTYDGTYWVNEGSSLSIYNAYNYNNLSNKPTIPTLPSNIVNTITTTAGTHTAITSQKGDVSFNVPTKTSHLTNDSGFITSDSDEKLKIDAVANNTTNTTYYPILATNSTAAATRYYDSTGIHYNNVNGSTTVVGKADLVLGNSTASGSVNNKMGTISLYSSTSNYGYFTTTDLTAQRTYTFPDATGTVALTSDVTDEKLTIEQVLDSTSTTYTYYPILARKATTNGIRQIDETGFKLNNRNGSADDAGYEELILGNSTAEGTAGNKRGWLTLYTRSTYYARLYASADLTANRELALPNESGTIALTSDIPSIPTIPTITLNGTATTSPSFYAPTTAGTSGYVLKSNGSGAPTWTSATLTDTKVTQTASTTSAWRKVLGSYNSATAADGSITSGTANVSYYDADGPSFNTSTGELYTKGYKMYLATTDSLYTAINNLGWVSAVIE